MTGNLGTDLLIYGISALFAIVAIVGLVEQIKHHRRVNSSEYAVGIISAVVPFLGTGMFS